VWVDVTARLRVVAGTAGGRRLVAPKGARPTTDRVKEAVFSLLGDERIQGAAVLDLYAGSGALGIEALSRGAVNAVFVDRDRGAQLAIRANLEVTGFTERGRLVGSAVAPFLARAATRAPDESPIEVSFDLVFVDPPYDAAAGEVARVLQALADGGMLAAGATVVLERGRLGHPPALPGRWQIEKERSYGDTLIVVATA
jgi:16S rRNA (guanine966-N2)-methyltransferase